MRVWAQSSQRSACPPSAAVRQFSMADMTLSWPRLTWPALALRQAAPKARKISATSSNGRDTRAALYVGGAPVPLFLMSLSSGLVTARIVLVATWV